MEHGLDTGALAVVAACFVLWALVSARLERLNVSAPIAFVVLGLAVAHEPLSLLDVHITSSTMRSVAEITLALVLFGDASRVNVRELRADVTASGPPSRDRSAADDRGGRRVRGRVVRRGRHLGRRASSGRSLPRPTPRSGRRSCRTSGFRPMCGACSMWKAG